MGEHDDDLESAVTEGAEMEQDSYPATGEELDEENPPPETDSDEDVTPDEDEAEL